MTKRSECRLEKRSGIKELKIFGMILFAFILIVIGISFVSAACTKPGLEQHRQIGLLQQTGRQQAEEINLNMLLTDG